MEKTRREFLKTTGLGISLIATSRLWSNNLFAALTLEKGNNMNEEYFGFTKEDLKKLLAFGLSKGADLSELYFEHTIANSVTMSEDIIKSSSQDIALGVGTRVIHGNQTGYAFTNELTFESIKNAMLTAASIAKSKPKIIKANLEQLTTKSKIYDLSTPFAHANLQDKIELIKTAYNTALKYDSRIQKVSVSLLDNLQQITIANSDGLIISDTRPQMRIGISVTAEDKGKRGTSFASEGGRFGMDFKNAKTPQQVAETAASEALILLEAENPPTGEQIVVLSKDQSGVMIHEAVGHPLEADANWKKQSIMWDKMNQMVSKPFVTIYDDATIPYYRGSLAIDDEGTITENVLLIENGKLVGFMNDRLSAKIMNTKPNGHGRRESYKHIPIPRMNNTILAQGEHDPEEIIKSVKKGFYAVSYQGGQVSNTGKFTFSCNLGYLIEDGKLTKPLKNATLIGTNVQILNEISMIGNDIGFFLGTCGKEGQSVPVTCGTPTLKIDKMTVGGAI